MLKANAEMGALGQDGDENMRSLRLPHKNILVELGNSSKES